MTNYVARRRVRTASKHTIIIICACIFAFPFYILLNLSLKTPAYSYDPITPAVHPTLSNYADAWGQANLGPALLNSLIVTVLSTILIVVIAALTAYPLSRSTRKWSSGVYYLFVLGLVIPFQLAMVPLYTTLRDLQLLGTLWGLVLFYTGAQLPFAVFMYTTFLRSADRDYEEAAQLDGAGPIRTFWSVVLPLARPITGTVAILNVITVWNDFFAPLLFLGNEQATVPIALYGFVGTYYSAWNLVFAGLVLSALPILIVYMFMQKTVIQGFAGGLKA